MNPITVMSIVLAALIAACAPVSAQAPAPSCLGKRSVIAAAAARGERLLWQGAAGAVGAAVLLGKPDGSAWRLYAVRPDGRACLVAAGIGHTGIQRTVRVPERVA